MSAADPGDGTGGGGVRTDLDGGGGGGGVPSQGTDTGNPTNGGGDGDGSGSSSTNDPGDNGGGNSSSSTNGNGNGGETSHTSSSSSSHTQTQQQPTNNHPTTSRTGTRWTTSTRTAPNPTQQQPPPTTNTDNNNNGNQRGQDTTQWQQQTTTTNTQWQDDGENDTNSNSNTVPTIPTSSGPMDDNSNSGNVGQSSSSTFRTTALHPIGTGGLNNNANGGKSSEVSPPGGGNAGLDNAMTAHHAGGGLSGSGKAGVAIGVLAATAAVLVALHYLTRYYRAKKTKSFFMRSSMVHTRNDSAFSWHDGGDKGAHLSMNNEKAGGGGSGGMHSRDDPPDSYTPDAISPSSGDALNSSFSPLGSGPLTGAGADFRGSSWMEHLGLGKPGLPPTQSSALNADMLPARHSSVDEGGVRISVVAPSIGSSQAAILGRQNGHSRASSQLSGNHLHPLFIRMNIPSPTLKSPKSPMSKAFGVWSRSGSHNNNRDRDRDSKSSAVSATATTPAVTSSEHSPTMLRSMVNSFPMPFITTTTPAANTIDPDARTSTFNRTSVTAPTSPHSPKRFASNNPFRNSVGASTVLTRAHSPFVRHSQTAFSEDENKNPFEFEFESNGLDLDFTQLGTAPTARSSGLTPHASSGHTTINPTTPVTPAPNKRHSASSVSIYSIEQSQPFHPSNPFAQGPSGTATGASSGTHTRFASARESMGEDLIAHQYQYQLSSESRGAPITTQDIAKGEHDEQQKWAPLDFKMSRESSRKPSFSSGFDESAWADEVAVADPSPHTPKTFSKILDMYAGRAM